MQKSTRRPSNASQRFDESTLADLRTRLPDFLEAAGVELRRTGSRLVGRCPVHEDRTPSFAVFGATLETAGCYPCEFTGDVFAVSKWLGRSSTFPEALDDVSATLGIRLHDGSAKPATARPRAKKPQPEAFALSEADRKKIHLARLEFSNAFHSGDPIISEISDSLGIGRETLRLAAWGSSGLGIASPEGYGSPWLCYAFPAGLKWRNPDPLGKPRFVWLVGKALAPWRSGWIKPETHSVYVTEGESDTLAMIAAGIEADGTAVAVASPGTSFPREWASLFTGKRVILCFDFDDPGRAATATVAAILKGHAAEILTWKGTARHV